MDFLNEGLSQLGLLRENKYSAIPSRLTILKKGPWDGEVGSLDVEQDGLDSQLHSPRALRLSNIVILLADNSFTNQPSLDTVHSMFEELEIPFKEYLEMIASFFPVKPPNEGPIRLRPAPYPESPVDIRFPSRSQLQPLGNRPEELCYNIYVVDNPPPIRETPESFSIMNLTKNLPIHKCAIFIDPSNDRVVLTSTFQGLRKSLMQIKYHDHEIYSIPPLIYAFQYVITETATVGWDRCLDLLETALEDVLHRLFAPRRDSKNTDQEVILLSQHWENLNALQHCCSDLQGLIRANQRVLSAIGDTEAYSPFAQSGKQFLTRLEWHMDRAIDLKTTIKTGLCRAEHNLSIAQQSRREWVSRSSLKILFIFENFFRSIAYSLLIFLPAIFVAAFFSSSFFGPDENLSSLWIFFVVLFPLTLITILLNGAWYRLLAGLWSLEGFRLRSTREVAHLRGDGVSGRTELV